MKLKTYLFQFLIFPDGKNPNGEVWIKAQNQGATPMSDEELQKAARAIAAAHIDSMNPLTKNPGTLAKTAEEETPTTVLRRKQFPDVIVWESNERIRAVS